MAVIRAGSTAWSGTRAASAWVLSAVALTTLSACSVTGGAAQCAEILGVVSDGTATLRDLAADPATVPEKLRELATELRSAGETAGGDVQTAAEDIAAGYEQIAAGIEDGEIPDVEVLTGPTTALANACRP